MVVNDGMRCVVMVDSRQLWQVMMTKGDRQIMVVGDGGVGGRG